jgi:putative DNA-invertase from lambdoid prophage Rac
MSRAFAYVRVSTNGQTTENQIQEIEAAGFRVEPHRVISETISGSVAISARPGFIRLLDRLETGDILIVTKMDRLGRNTIDVSSTVHKLDEKGIRVHCLALGGVDLASPAGKMTMNVINAVAQFERDLLIERTNAGLRRAKSEGTKLGRPSALSASRRAEIGAALVDGQKVAPLAKRYGVSRQTIMRIRDALQLDPVPDFEAS